jgi:NADPH:quinone reductase-like Zn-dependent oxidoreductase
VDVYTIEGKAYMSALSLPYIPGWDVSGVVEAVGYGVTRFQPGDEIFGMPWFPRAGGGYAEFVTAPARHFARKPKSLDFINAAALPLAGLTAWQMLVDVAKVDAGCRVLINGAAGGVGHLAVQVAKARGAYVIAVAREEKHPFLLSLGANQVIDYTRVSVPDVVSDADVVIELVGGEVCLKMLAALRKDGLLISAQSAWAPKLQSEASRLAVRASWYLVEPDHVGLEALVDLVERGQLKVRVSEVLPLGDVAEALRLVSTKRTT